MKMILLGLILIASFSSLANFNNNCIDARLAFFGPCEDGQERVYVQGLCEMSYEVESTYCASKKYPICTNTMVAFFGPCEDGEERVFVQGRCEKPHLIEHTYCAQR